MKNKYITPEQFRIQLICNILEKGASLKKIKNDVNDKLRENNLKQYSNRIYSEDIRKIREGDFDYIGKDKKEQTFSVIYYVSLDQYRFEEDTPFPKFSLLDENERLTVPFLKGILKPYESLPAVGKILNELNEIFDLTEEEIKSSAAVVVTKPIIHNSEKVHENIIKILEHIKNKNCVEFMYTTVHNLNDKLSASFMCEIIPLQIKLHENLYYLIGQNIKKENRIVNFRIDKIKGSIDAIEDEETGELKKFNSIDIKSLNLEQYFKNVIGVWCYSEKDKTETIKIKFRDWAASYILAQPLHDSQKIIRDFYKVEFGEKVFDEIIISIDTRLSPEFDNDNNRKKTILERSNELAFLLGRFREFCEVIE
ncbi:hypothetical protein GCM10022389_20670 [Flavobacterium cheonanense]|uniref:WYL domain-containing protein n=1 Tax=Flavobacterium cheonanense TaxID=706183 RepID=A0ABP7VVD8_9FLAO